MATAYVEDRGPVCPICVDSFTKPKMLNCGHSYCLDCLKSYVGEDDVDFFRCAVCRLPVGIPDGGLEAFQTNFALEKSAPVVINTSKCQNHAEKDAECYCRKCYSTLCYKCLHWHHKDHGYFDLNSEAARVTVNEEFSKYENNVREYIDEMKTVSKSLSSTITTFSYDECKKVDDLKMQLFAEIEAKSERAKKVIRHKCGEKLSEVEEQEEKIMRKAENTEVELVSVLSSTSNDSIVTRLQGLPKLKQLDTGLNEVKITVPKIDVLEWSPGNIEIPDYLGMVQIKPLLFPTLLNSSLVKPEDPDDGLQFVSSEDDTDEPDVQFSFVFNFERKDLEEMEAEDTYYSQDQFSVTALKKLIWRCFMQKYADGMFSVDVVLLQNENRDIDHCVIDYKLTLSQHEGDKPFVFKHEQNARFCTTVSQEFDRDNILGDYLFYDPFQVQFDIIRVRGIFNKV